MDTGAVRRTRIGLLSVVLLAFASGAADAFGFLELGGIFTANMTGNLVLAGLFTRPDYLATLAGAGAALAAFPVGLAVGFRLSRGSHRSAVLALLPILTAAAAGVWWAVGTDAGARFAVIALSAAALGVQTVLSRRVSGELGLTGTYQTGTLTALVEDLVDHKRGGRLVKLGSIVALVLGAVVGTLAASAAPALAPVPMLLTTLVAVALLGLRRPPVDPGALSTPYDDAPASANLKA